MDHESYQYDVREIATVEEAMSDMADTPETSTQANILLHTLVELAPREDWSSIVAHLPPHDALLLQYVERMADNLAATYAEISAYMGARGAYGYGDQGHEQGIKLAQAQRKQVRKALGYK